MTPRTIAFVSTSPSSGKTIACANLAVLLAQMGHRVLVVDLDPQAHATQVLGAVPETKLSIGAVLAGRQTLAGIVRHTTVPNVYLGAAAPEPPDQSLSPARALDRLDFQRLTGHAPPFGFILVDTPTCDDLRQRLSLTVCDEAIIPVKPALKGLYAATPTLQMILEARAWRDSDAPDLLGFLPLALSAERELRNVRAKLHQFNLPCFTPVRRCQRLKPPMGVDRFERRLIALTGPDLAATADFRQVAREIVMGLEPARMVARWCARAPTAMTPRARRPRPRPYF